MAAQPHRLVGKEFQFHLVRLKVQPDSDGQRVCQFQFHLVRLKALFASMKEDGENSFNSI